MNRLAHSFHPVGMLHLEKWSIRWVNNKVAGLSSSQKRPRVLTANGEWSTSQQRALAGESSSSSSLATAQGQGRAGVLPPPAQCLLGHTLDSTQGRLGPTAASPAQATRLPGMTALSLWTETAGAGLVCLGERVAQLQQYLWWHQRRWIRLFT